MERRKVSKNEGKPSALPHDYTQMVIETFTQHFEPHIQGSRFEIRGAIYTDEIVVSASVVRPGQLTATTVYASSDFDPKASAPGIQELLAASIDAIATVFEQYFASLAAPKSKSTAADNEEGSFIFDWAETEANRIKLFVRLDHANPVMDELTDQWLAQNDPEFEAKQKELEAETESLFITGPKNKKLH